MKNMRLFGKVALSLFLTLSLGCSTAHKRAEKFMEQSLYGEAEQVYEQILKEDPKDTEAAVGLKKARNGFIEKKLIAVRMARMAGGSVQSLKVFLHVVQKEAE